MIFDSIENISAEDILKYYEYYVVGSDAIAEASCDWRSDSNTGWSGTMRCNYSEYVAKYMEVQSAYCPSLYAGSACYFNCRCTGLGGNNYTGYGRVVR